MLVLALLLSCIMAACGGGEADTVRPDSLPPVVDGVPQTITATTPPEPPTSTALPEMTAVPTPTQLPAALASPTATTPPRATSTAAAVEPTPSPVPDEPPGPVIVLDPGHDRTTPGALGIEYQENLRTALITQQALEAAGYRVFLTRTDNDLVFVDDLTLLPPNAADMHPGYSHAYAHASAALRFNPDMVIVLHFNGHPNSDVAGVEIYYCENGGEQNLVLAEMLRDEISVALRSLGHEPPSSRVLEDLTVARGNRHFPSLGNVYDPPTEFVENRYAGIPVALTEPLYMTNATERALIEDDATHLALAEAYVRVADRYFGR